MKAIAYFYVAVAIGVWTWLANHYDFIFFAINEAFKSDKEINNVTEQEVQFTTKFVIFLGAILWPVTLLVMVFGKNGK